MAGALLILVAWLPQTIRSLKSGGKGEDMEFVELYTIGTALLLYHSIIIHDITFAFLNGFILAFVLIHLAIKLRRRKA